MNKKQLDKTRLVILCMSLLLTAVLTGCNKTVPNVVNLTQAAAEAVITNAELTVGTVETEYSDTVAAGNVISQDPLAGTSAPRGSAINLTVSIGPEPVNVPNVVNMTQSAAEAALTSAGLAVGTISQAVDAVVAVGNVISQSPAAGASVLPGSAVNLVISSGPPPVIVPNVVNLTQAAAEAALAAAGLTAGAITQAANDVIPAGSVISQNPAAGASVPPGTAVALTVSSGPALVNVPSVVGMTQANAETMLTGQGLVLGSLLSQYSNVIVAGSVVSQSPPASTAVAPGTAVNMIISLGGNGVNITTIQDLQKIGQNPAFPIDGNYVLLNDIDASATLLWNGGKGFEPIGTGLPVFTGVFDGQGFAISNLVINRPTENFVALFNGLNLPGEIKNVDLLDIEIVGLNVVGGLVGWTLSTVTNCCVTGSIKGGSLVGGLIGRNDGTVDTCCSTAEVEATSGAGGLVGGNLNGDISYSYAAGPVKAGVYAAGLLGVNDGGSIERCYASGDVESVSSAAGGLVARNMNNAEIRQCCATGNISAAVNGVGGLVASNESSVIVQCFATGEVTGLDFLGGLVGRSINPGAAIDQCYSIGAVAAPAPGTLNRGGLAGESSLGALITDSFWDRQTSGRTELLAGALGITTAQMQTQSTFTDATWDFTAVWAMQAGGSYPYLQALPDVKP